MAVKQDIQNRIVIQERQVLEIQEQLNRLNENSRVLSQNLVQIEAAQSTATGATKQQLVAAQASLKTQIASLTTQVRAQEALLISVQEVLAGRVRDLNTATGGDDDAYFKLKRSVSALSDKFPVLLFPVRIETRFVKSGNVNQLWIRVYPDTCNITVDRNYITDAELDSLIALYVKNVDEMAVRHGYNRAAFLTSWLDANKGKASFKDVFLNKKRVELRTHFGIDLRKQKPVPVTTLLPDQFVFRLIDPSGSKTDFVGANVPEGLPAGFDETQASATAAAWMHNFDEAVAKGMGIKINLTTEQHRDGFSKIVVFGVRTKSSAGQTQIQLESLFQNHQYSSGGISFVPQGTPTNNSDSAESGYDPEQQEPIATGSFTSIGGNTEGKSTSLNDGAWFSQFLGINDALVQKFSNSGNTDQTDARRMNRVLFPATLGYFLKEMMDPEISDAQVRAAESFFNNYVLGRGSVPALRIGKQPYGIMPASVFSRFSLKTTDPVRAQIATIVKSFYPYWSGKIGALKHVSSDSALSSEDFLQLLSLHPASISYFLRKMEDVSDKVTAANQANVTMLPAINNQVVESMLFTSAQNREKLTAVGLNPDLSRPDIMFKLFDPDQTNLSGPVIEAPKDAHGMVLKEVFSDRELLTENYLSWMAKSDYDTILREVGLNLSPKPLFFLLLKHAYQLKYADAAMQSKSVAYGKPMEQVSFAYKDNQVITKSANSKQSLLFQPDKKITGSATIAVSDYLLTKTKEITPLSPVISELKSFISNLEPLSALSKGKLERAFAEHLDCCNYRIDAWIGGLFAHQLRTQRQQTDGVWSKGIFTGAYGYVENVKAKASAQNLGYMLTPSPNHAATAAILKNAQVSYQENTANPFTINLSSERVLLAKQLLDGVRRGASLSQLMGYRFERLLGDKNLQKYLFEFRKLYPLKVPTTVNTDTGATNFMNKNLVVDGVKVLRDFEIKKAAIYNNLAGVTGEEKDKFAAVFNVMQNAMDALKDLMMSEGVFQMVQSNFERGAATLDSLTAGKYPADPDIIKTPRSGVLLSHKVGLHLKLIPPVQNARSVRACLEPTVNAWLNSCLPLPELVVCLVKTKAVPAGFVLSMKDLSLEAIDLLFMLGRQKGEAFPLLTDCIAAYIAEKKSTQIVEIQYRRKGRASEFSFFEISALLVPIRKLLLKSREMSEQDLVYSSTSTSVFTNKVTAAHLLQLTYLATFLESRNVTVLDDADKQSLAMLQKNLAIAQQMCLRVNDARFSLSGFIHRMGQVLYENVPLPDAEHSLLVADILTIKEKIKADIAKLKVGVSDLAKKTMVGSDFSTLKNSVIALLGDEQIFTAHTILSNNASEIQKAFTDTSILDFAKNKSGYLYPVQEWMESIARVRKNMWELDSASAMLSALKDPSFIKITPMQFPYESGDRWMALPFKMPNESRTVKGKVLYTYIDTQNTRIGDGIAGMIIDEWTEEIPNETETLGLGFHYNRPNAEAPQAMLLVTPPEIKGSWNIEDIPDTILSTMELSKVRAVEPEQLSDTPLAQFIPSVVLYSTLYGTSVSTNLLRNLTI